MATGVTQELLKQLPNARVISTVSQDENEAEWLAVRNKGIGGSDVGAICGVSPFSSARQIYLDKTGQYDELYKGLNANEGSWERMRFGHLLEPIVADEFQRRELTEDKGRKGWTLCSPNATFCAIDAPWKRANVDRLIMDENGKIVGILECKTTSEYNNEEWESGDILMSYIYQLNWYMHILDIKWGAFACLVGGNKFYSYEVYRNDELLNDTIIPTVTNFWFNNVQALKEPELQGVDTNFAANLYAEVEKNTEVVLDDDESNNLAAVVFECKAKIKELTATMEEAQNRLKDRLKNNEIGYCKDYTVKWSPRSQSRVDSTALKVNFPEVYEKCKKTISFRVMTIKGMES